MYFYCLGWDELSSRSHFHVYFFHANPGLRHVPACPDTVCCGKVVLPVKQMTDAQVSMETWASLSPKSEQSLIFHVTFRVSRFKKLKIVEVSQSRRRSLSFEQKQAERSTLIRCNHALPVLTARSGSFTHQCLHNGKCFRRGGSALCRKPVS